MKTPIPIENFIGYIIVGILVVTVVVTVAIL